MSVTDDSVATDPLVIAGRELRSRLLLGTGGFRSLETLGAAIEALDLPAEGRGVAVAVNAEVVPRTEWETTELRDGARVEVLRAIQGG